MKKYYVIISAIMIVSLLCACNSSGYHYVVENGCGYITIEHTASQSDMIGSQVEESRIRFASYAEMVADIRDGNFTETEMKELAEFPCNKDGRIKVLDINNVYFPVLPDGSSGEIAKIDWYGNRFELSATHPIGELFFIQIEDSSDWESFRDRRLGFSKKQPIDYDVERNATVYKWIDGSDRVRYSICFDIEINNTCVYVCESFLNEYSGAPSQIIMFGSTGTLNYIISIGDPYWVSSVPLPERPSTEFLKQITIERYIGE
jgi:hypothetical protein